jgi:hypothetical protein
MIHAYDLNGRKSWGHIKCSNASPNRLLIDTDIQRMYVTTREGMLLFFDIENPTPLMIHSMRVVLRPDPGVNFVK